MAETITIEGSQTPSVELARGKRRTVQRTERIDRLIARGYVVEVKDETAAKPEPEPTPDAGPDPVEVKDDTAKPRATARPKPADGE